MSKWREGILAGLIFLASGCSTPDAYRVGIVERRIEWQNTFFHGKTGVTLARIEGIWKDEKLDKYARLDYISVADNKAKGYGEQIGFGFRYYPFCKGFGIEFGGELFYANAASIWEYGPVKIKTPFDGYGYGWHVGVDNRIKINSDISVFLCGGHYFAESFISPIEINADGWYFSGGLEFNLTTK